jgi:hypothetical protein
MTLTPTPRLDREFAKVVPGETTLNDLEGNVFMHTPDGVEIHADEGGLDDEDAIRSPGVEPTPPQPASQQPGPLFRGLDAQLAAGLHR